MTGSFWVLIFSSLFIFILSMSLQQIDIYSEQQRQQQNLVYSGVQSADTKTVSCPSGAWYNYSKGRCEIDVDISSNCPSGMTELSINIAGTKKKCIQYVDTTQTQEEDIKKQSCEQALIQVCMNILKQCNASTAVEGWGWVLAANVSPYNSLQLGSDYSLNAGNISASQVNLSNLDNLTPTPTPSCSDKVLLGQYYYLTYIKRLNCSQYKVDLNNLPNTTKRFCSVSDILKK